MKTIDMRGSTKAVEIRRGRFGIFFVTAVVMMTLLVAPLQSIAATNLIQNPSFEDELGGLPTAWSQGGFGSNTRSHVYPVSGTAGAKAVRVEIENATYIDGDAKWVFDDIAVDSGKNYIYSEMFKSNAPSKVFVRFNKGNCPAVEADCAYSELGTLIATPDWTAYQTMFLVPDSVTTLTLFHSVIGVSTDPGASWLEVDDVSLAEESAPQFNVPNHSVEDEAIGGATPLSWQYGGYGTNLPVFEYIKDDGADGDHSVKVTVTGYVDGDAKWIYATQPVDGGEDYHFSAFYKVGKNPDDLSDTAVVPHVVAQYTKANGDISYFGMPRPEPNGGTGWQQYDNEFSVPSDVVSATVFFFLAQDGWLQTDNYKIVSYDYEGFDRGLVTLTFDDGFEDNVTTALPKLNELALKTTQCYTSGAIHDADEEAQAASILMFLNSGHEICSHTISHPDLTTLTPAQLESELADSRAYLEGLTGTLVPNFASPFGAYNAEVVAATKNHYGAHRTVDEGYNSEDNLDLYRLKVQNMKANTTLAEFKEWVNKAKQENLWLILVYHKVTTAAPEEFDTSATDFADQMDWLAAQSVPVKTVADAIAEITSSDPVVPTLAFSATPPAITAGDSATLAWDSTDATACTASGGWSGAQGVDGNLVVSPLSTTVYTLDCTGAGGPVNASVTVTVSAAVDTSAPEITVLGADPMGIELGGTYVEPGATALDNVDGNISGNVVIDAASVNTSIAGTYTVTYNVSDAAGNPAVQKTRTVTVAARSLTITADAKSKVAGDADPALTYAVTAGSLLPGGAFTGSLVRASGEAVGTYSIDIGSLSAGSNYAVNFIGALFSITAANVPTCPTGTTLQGNSCVPQSSGGGGSRSGGSGKRISLSAAAKSVTSAVLGASTTTTSVSTSTNSYVFTLPLYFGVSGTEVVELQKKLTALGYYSGPITGFYGSMTEAAVRRLQTANGIEPAGFVGPKTRVILNK